MNAAPRFWADEAPARLSWCAVMSNDRAPAGFVEVQRDDETAPADFDDEDAARCLCLLAKVPVSFVIRMADADEETETEGGALSSAEAPPPKGSWTVLVPAIVAMMAGALNEADAVEATCLDT